ncbi:MAG: hypothetical protein ACK5N0_04400 [Synechococcaceae cyanobacterium]
MASRRSDAAVERSVAPGAEPAAAQPDNLNHTTMPEWLTRVLQQGVKPEQALAVIGLGLMNGLAEAPSEHSWLWTGEGDEPAGVDAGALHQRLETVQLALETGAPLSTAEVTLLLGARPGAAEVQRGGLTARRQGRNVWKLTRSGEAAQGGGTAFREGFRRRL